MSVLEFHNTLNLILGVVAFVLPLIAARYFHNSTILGKGVALMFFGEAVAMLCTLAFAYSASTGLLEALNGSTQAWMRTIMFLITTLTSVNLCYIVWAVMRGDNG